MSESTEARPYWLSGRRAAGRAWYVATTYAGGTSAQAVGYIRSCSNSQAAAMRDAVALREHLDRHPDGRHVLVMVTSSEHPRHPASGQRLELRV